MEFILVSFVVCGYIVHRHLKKMKVALFLVLLFMAILSSAQVKVKVACIGNSITEGAEIEKALRYPEQLQTMLGDGYEVRNYGLGGRTLLRKGDFSYWQEEKYKEVLAWNPDVIIIKLGTNDSKPQNWIYADEFEKDYRDFIRSFKHPGGHKRIYICTPVPVFRDEWGITANIVNDEIIPKIKTVAKAEGVPVVDLYNPMLEKADLFPDGVHPNAGGARLIAEEVYKALGKQ
jgi:acyl-CoA thioesterase-1